MSFIPEALVGHWAFGGQSIQRRGTIIDRSGSGNTGTIYGTPALSFDGGNDWAKVAAPWDTLGGHRYLWFAARIKPGTQTATRILWHEEWNASASLKISIRMDATDKLLIYARAGALGDTARTSTSTSAVAEGSWQNLLVAIDLGSDGTVANGFAAYAWIDGQVFAMGAFSGDATQGTFAADVPSWQAMGTDEASGNDWLGLANWIGYSGMDTLPTIVDAQKFYDNSQAWLDQAGLDAWWYCDKVDKDNPNPQDQSGNGHHLALTGATWDVTDNGGNHIEQVDGAEGDSFYNGGRWFGGDDDRVAVGDHPTIIPGTAEFQIHVWAKCSSTQPNANGVFFGKGLFGAGDWMFRLQLTGGEHRLSFTGVGANVQEDAGVNRADDTLHLFSAMRNGTAMRIYVDAVQVKSIGGAGDDLTSADDLNIASSDDNNGRSLAADIYEVFYSIGTKSLTKGRAEMAAIFETSNYR